MLALVLDLQTQNEARAVTGELAEVVRLGSGHPRGDEHGDDDHVPDHPFPHSHGHK